MGDQMKLQEFLPAESEAAFVVEDDILVGRSNNRTRTKKSEYIRCTKLG